MKETHSVSITTTKTTAVEAQQMQLQQIVHRKFRFEIIYNKHFGAIMH